MTDQTRRNWITSVGSGLAGIALNELLLNDGAAANKHPVVNDTRLRKPHYKPKAKAVIQLFMHGGPSQVDLFDPKPMLRKYSGKTFPGLIDVQQPEQSGGVLDTPFKFRKYGDVGIPVSNIMPHVAKWVDEITLIRSMYSEHINHEPALWMIHTGRTVPGRPSIGSWVVYGLGNESQDLPAYVVLDDPRGLPVDGIRNWSAGWLPPVFQGTRFRATGTPVWNLQPARSVSTGIQKARRSLLSQLDRRHREQRPYEPQLDARIASYELAARMQVSAQEALDLGRESRRTHELYGLNNSTTQSYGRRCLMARRLVERGVRYVQIFINGQIWDNHANLESGMRASCARTDLPVAGLLQDLKQRGLLDETLVVWGGEFGRLPISQSKNGRDHNHRGFCMWMAGGGVKAGHVHGATDDFGYAAVTDRVGVPDWHATVLHLLGLDHKRLVYNRNGLEDRLTGVSEPRIVREILA